MAMKLTNHRDTEGRIYRLWGPFQFGKNQETGKWIVMNSAGHVLEANTLEKAKDDLFTLLNNTPIGPKSERSEGTPGYSNMGGGMAPG